MAFLILAHVDTGHHRVVVEQVLGQRLGELGLADARRAEEDERSDRTARVLKSGPRAAHGVRYGLDRLILTDDTVVQFALHLEQLLALALQHPADRYARPAGHDLGDVFGVDLFLDHRAGLGVLRYFGLQAGDFVLGFAHLAVADFGHASVIAVALGLGRLHFQVVERLLVLLYLLEHVAFALPFGPKRRPLGIQLVDLARQLLDPALILLAADRLALDLELPDLAVQLVDLLGNRVHLEPQLGRRLVDQIDRLIGQEARCDVAVRQFDRRDDRLVLDPHLVVVLVTFFQTPQDRDRVYGRRLVDHDFLEPSLERLVLLEIFLELVERRRADRAQLASRQSRLQDVRGVHRAVALAGADQRVDLVDEQQNFAFGRNDLLDDRF